MKIIIISSNVSFTPEQIKSLKSLGEVVYIRDAKKIKNNPIFKKRDEKIVAVGPGIVDWKFPNSFIDKISNLKGICVPSTSFSWIDGEYLRKKGIVLTNVPQYSTDSVAEYAISLMFGVAKKLPLVIKNGWKIDYEKHQGFQVKGKTMGIIGLGAIGTRIAELGKGMNMKVIYWSRKNRDKRFTYKSLDRVLEQADFIFPALAKNEETKNLLDKKKISLMKEEAYIVSITGDEISDLDFAAKQVQKGRLAGVALEMKDKTIKDFEGNVWVTPPIAWFTKEAFEEDMRIWVKSIQSVIKGKPINVVN